MSSYFTLPSFARAKKNQEELQKTNPTDPVLKDEDEKFLERHISQDEGPKPDLPPRPTNVAKIADDGEMKNASPAEAKAAEGDVVVPETQPKDKGVSSEEESRRSFELPSQEEAEATTRGWNSAVKRDDEKPGSSSGEKKTWASYLPAKLQPAKKDGTDSKEKSEDDKNSTTETQGSQRTWGEYASNLVLSNSLPAWPESWTWSKDKDATPEPVYNEDGTVNEEKTKEKQEKEVSVLLDNLNMSAINNRVFAFNQETQKFYERFAQVLKDTINGVPTAYDDMDKLMRDAGPTLEKQFKTMPPFVQTLVKSLPAKFGASLAPEIMAATSEKPGADLKAKRAAEGSSTPTSSKPENKKKRTIPGLKKLMSKEGVVATMLRNTVNFLTTRFPFLASTTNVVLSLSVFILMFVFWYCHKRGKEVRLANESASSSQIIEEDDGDVEVSGSDNEDDAAQAELEKTLNQPDPAQVPLPRTDSEVGEKK
ncbi:hypothetical protein Slin15195_G087130 [Septoria linicola]|uniref:Uncharacterized protein n=1 Tax=Septoria linicola TaxID=215465 RepID=A0A9Q9EME8_9PEZI|nr:hypothetical protein Slin14017_G089720 [Septoria linicola]USW55394.1 hypothetical protein Slin15195_G087130 [Septoria linicola]